MKKAIILIIAIVVLLPVVVRLIPEPMSIERVEKAFEDGGYMIAGLEEAGTAQREAVQEWRFTVEGYRVEVYRYDSEGKIAKNLAYLQPDPGQEMVVAMNLAQQLGAAESKDLPSAAVRKGKWLIYVVGKDKSFCKTLAAVFKRS